MIEILKALPEDALQIAIVNVYTWKTQYSGLMGDSIINQRIRDIEKTSEKIKSRLEKDNNYIVAKKDNTVIGFCRYDRCFNKDYEEYGEINALYILEGFKSQGIGRKLFEKAREELQKMSYKKLRVNCLKGNSSLGFYTHMGGKVKGEFENTFYGEKVTEEIIVFDEGLE